MTDEDLANLSFDIDDVIMLLCKQYGVTPFMLSSVMLARLAVMNLELGDGEDWNRLLGECINKVEKVTENTVVH